MARRNSHRRSSRKRPFRLENLEARCLMAADLGVLDDALASSPALFDALQESVDQQVLAAEAPLVGNQLGQGQASSPFDSVANRLEKVSLAAGASVAETAAELQQQLGDLLIGDIVTKGQDGDSEIQFQWTVGGKQSFTGDVAFDLEPIVAMPASLLELSAVPDQLVGPRGAFVLGDPCRAGLVIDAVSLSFLDGNGMDVAIRVGRM